jgi:hypothetical protein
MSRTDYRTLLNRGRKAGLSTAELYSAIAARPVAGGDQPGQADANGYTASLSPQGRSVYRPLDTPRRA